MAPTSSLVSKIKVHLKLSISRLRIVQQKDQAIAKQQRRAMAQLLEQGKHESARIRVENIIRSDLTTELYEILELYCELLLARINLLEPAACDPGLEEAVKSIIYAAPRTDIKELQQARALMVEKFGKEFATAAMENREGRVPERVLRKLRVEPPGAELVESYLKAIAGAYGVKYGEEEEDEVEVEDVEVVDAAEDDDDDDEGGGGGGGGQAQKELEPALLADSSSPSAAVGTSGATAPQPPPPPAPAEVPTAFQAAQHTPPPKAPDLGARSPLSIAPPSPSTDNANPKVRVPSASASAGAGPGTPVPELKPNAKMKKSGGAAEGGGAAAKGGGGATTTTTAAANGGVVKGKTGGGSGVPDLDDLERRFALLRE